MFDRLADASSRSVSPRVLSCGGETRRHQQSRRRSRRRAIRALAVAAAVGAIPAAGASAAPVPITAPLGASFVGSMEAPLSTDFTIRTDGGAAAPQRVTSPVRLGSDAVSMTVRPGQERSELQAAPGGIMLKVMPGSTEWFADSMYLEPGFPSAITMSSGWQMPLQWKDAGGTRSSSPPISVDIRNGAYTLAGGYGCPSSGLDYYRLTLAPATTGTWTDFEFQIHFDTAGRGWVTAYVNNRLVISHYVPPCGTAYPAPYSRYQILRLGYYRNPAISTTGTIVHDEYRMGPSRASVSLYG